MYRQLSPPPPLTLTHLHRSTLIATKRGEETRLTHALHRGQREREREDLIRAGDRKASPEEGGTAGGEEEKRVVQVSIQSRGLAVVKVPRGGGRGTATSPR